MRLYFPVFCSLLIAYLLWFGLKTYAPVDGPRESSRRTTVQEHYVAPIPTAAALSSDLPGAYSMILRDFAFVETSQASGSAVLFRRSDATGHFALFAWTCSHVIEPAPLATNDASSSFFAPPPAAPLVVTIRINGKAYSTRILLDSGASSGKVDVALLQVIDPPKNTGSVAFSSATPRTGSRVCTVGAAAGLYQPPSFFVGIVSAPDRVVDKSEMDQLECPVYPGCSGSGVFNDSGECEGLVDSMLTGSISFEVPSRAIIAWAKSQGAEWAVNPEVPLPNSFYEH